MRTAFHINSQPHLSQLVKYRFKNNMQKTFHNTTQPSSHFKSSKNKTCIAQLSKSPLWTKLITFTIPTDHRVDLFCAMVMSSHHRLPFMEMAVIKYDLRVSPCPNA
ncbi:hypothetical protein Tcan_00776, partial [Toxocara canis]